MHSNIIPEKNEKGLLQSLRDYSVSDAYPFHMPGHKRKRLETFDPYDIDITEIGGFDNLQNPKGLILDLEERLANLYGCDKAFLLVNGSTSGNLSMLYGALNPKDKVLCARNCHKSVYHGIEIRDLRAEYLVPNVDRYGIVQEIRAEEVREALDKDPEIKAFIMTSPTYEGIVSDIREIARVCHDRGVIFMVDAAHGAHQGIRPGFGENPVSLGADAVVVSLHKTLPMFTTTAAVLAPKDTRLDLLKLKRAINLFQSTSPSYILMAGVDAGLKLLEEKADESYKRINSLLKNFYKDTDKLKNLTIYRNKTKEPSKIVLISNVETYNGPDLMRELREKYKLELEMAVGQYALAMTSIMDDEEGFSRLKDALFEIDERLSRDVAKSDSEDRLKEETKADAEDQSREEVVADREGRSGKEDNLSQKWSNKSDCVWNSCGRIPEKKYEISQALLLDKEKIEIRVAAGRISATEVCIYPPGIPDLEPGELINQEIIDRLIKMRNAGLEVEGLDENGMIEAIKE